jgi:hypothetical protein
MYHDVCEVLPSSTLCCIFAVKLTQEVSQHQFSVDAIALVLTACTRTATATLTVGYAGGKCMASSRSDTNSCIRA